MKIRVTRARVKRAVTVLGRREHERDRGPGPVRVLHVDSGDRVLRGLALGVWLVPGGVLRYDKWLHRRKSLLTGRAKPLRKGVLQRDPKKRDSRRKRNRKR